MKTELTRQDAASMFGVSPQTISNWTQNGLLTLTRKGYRHYISRDSAEKLLYEMKENRDITVHVDEYCKQLNSLKLEIEKAKRELRLCRREKSLWKYNYFVADIIATIANISEDDTYLLKSKESEVLTSLITGEMSIYELAEKYNCTDANIRCKLIKAVRKLEKALPDLIRKKNAQIDMAKASYDKLYLEYINLKETYEAMKIVQRDEENRQMLSSQNLTPEQMSRCKNIMELLRTNIADCNLSIRALNCLRIADINTIGDLIQHRKTDLLSFRNFGKKSLIELDDFLESIGLDWNTNIPEFIKQQINQDF